MPRRFSTGGIVNKQTLKDKRQISRLKRPITKVTPKKRARVRTTKQKLASKRRK